MFRVFWAAGVAVQAFKSWACVAGAGQYPFNPSQLRPTSCWLWANISPALGQRLVFTGSVDRPPAR